MIISSRTPRDYWLEFRLRDHDVKRKLLACAAPRVRHALSHLRFCRADAEIKRMDALGMRGFRYFCMSGAGANWDNVPPVWACTCNSSSKAMSWRHACRSSKSGPLPHAGDPP